MIFSIMLSDVRAAREKNGIYISHERFVQEEAEKKVHDLKEIIKRIYYTFVYNISCLAVSNCLV